MGQIKLTTNIILTLLFSLAIIFFAMNFAIDNESDLSLADDDQFISIKNNLIDEASSFKTSTNSSSSDLMKSTIESGDETTRTGGQFKVTFTNMIGVIEFVIGGSFKKIFGQDTTFGIFLTTFSSVIVFIFGLYIWKSWRGNPD